MIRPSSLLPRKIVCFFFSFLLFFLLSLLFFSIIARDRYTPGVENMIGNETVLIERGSVFFTKKSYLLAKRDM